MPDVDTNAVVDERRAAVILGVAPPELLWFSRALGLGKQQVGGDPAHLLYTYEELKQLSSAAASSAK